MPNTHPLHHQVTTIYANSTPNSESDMPDAMIAAAAVEALGALAAGGRGARGEVKEGAEGAETAMRSQSGVVRSSLGRNDTTTSNRRARPSDGNQSNRGSRVQPYAGAPTSSVEASVAIPPTFQRARRKRGGRSAGGGWR